MKLLPIVGRELRESSRRRGTYWLRVRVAFQAVAIGIAAYVYNLFNPAVKLGTILFWGLSGVSMLFCLLAGRRSTADCLSQEKRDGTLGLLFLTDLKGYDVVLGKLAATSVTGLYALLAVFPVLAVPLLTGGTNSGEFERMLVTLTNTFFFSIAIGIFASAISRDHRTAMAANFLLWLLLVGAPVACAVALKLARSRAVPAVFGYSCPILSFCLSGDKLYAAAPADFWWSIGVTDGLAWALVLLTCWIVPRTWGDKPARAPSRSWRWRDLGSLISYGNAARRDAFRKEALDRNAYFWHAARARLKPVHVWMFLVLAATWWICCWVDNGRIWLDEVTFVATAVFLNTTFKLWIALEAGQRLGEDRRSGAFELLLATPLTVTDILRGQLLALRRQFLKPLAVVVVMECLFILVLLDRGHRIDALTVTVSLLVLAFDIVALIWVAMWAALRSKSQTQATVVTVARILILPWVVFVLVHAMTAALYWLVLIRWEPNERNEIFQWLGIALAVDLIFGLQAWRSLRRDFRRLATQSPRRTEWRLLLRRALAGVGALAGRVVPARLRIPLAAGLGVVAAVAMVHYARPKRVELTPPVVVSMTQSNGPLRVFQGGGEGVFLVLPDGSLWRWGATGTAPTSRAAMPEPVGTNHDWVKAVADGPYALGLRANGTIWGLAVISETNLAALQPAVPGSDWVDIGVASRWWGSIGLKKDGTIWSWSGVLPALSRQLTRIGTESNWTAISCLGTSYLGLQADGTLWVWGRITSRRNGSSWITRDYDAPALLCADTNWISLDARGRARNRAGELWDTVSCLPNPDASAVSVCRRIIGNWAGYRIGPTPYWMSCQLRTNGTLWTTPASTWNFPAPASTPDRQLGNRSDWVALWGYNGTSFGLTADGILWAWGIDFGHEAIANTRTRLQQVQALLNGQAQGGGPVWTSGGLPPPILEESRPLMKLVNASPN